MADDRSVDRRDDGATMSIEGNAIDQRGCFAFGLRAVYIAEQRLDACPVAELDAPGILALAIKIPRQRNARMPRMACISDPGLRTVQDFRNRHRWIGCN